jgi:hypothetical protein
MANMILDRMPEGDWDKIEAASDAVGQILQGCDFNVAMHSLLYVLAYCGIQLEQDGVTQRQFVQAVIAELQQNMKDITEIREERGEE